MEKILLALALLLFFSGCIDDSGIVKNRIDCLNLSSHASGILPKCEDEYSCFLEINKHFDFKTEFFSANTKLLLQDYTNDIARSWLYYNRALKNLKNIYGFCYSQTNTSELPRNLNELTCNIDESFNQINAANDISFRIIIAEKEYLESLDINKIKEEKLADDFIRLSDNLNQFQEKSPHKSDSYFYFYYQTLKEFEDLGNRFQIKTTFVKENDLINFIYSGSRKIMEKSKENKTSLFFPFILDFSGFLLEKIKNSKNIGEASNFLQNMPTFEFLKVYAKIASEKDSVNAKFIDMLKKLSLNYENTYDEANKLNYEITQNLQITKQGLNSDFYDYEKIYSLENINLEIKSKEFLAFVGDGEHISLDNLHAKVINLSIQINALNSGYLSGRISIGDYLSKLKTINNQLKSLQQSIDYLKSNYLKTVDDLCKGRIESIYGELNKLNEKNEKILLRIKWFYEADSFYEKAKHCEIVLENYSEMQKEIKTNKEMEITTYKKNSDYLEILSLFDKITKKLIFIKSIMKYCGNDISSDGLYKEFENLQQQLKDNSNDANFTEYSRLLALKIKTKGLFEKIRNEEKTGIKSFLEKNAEITSEFYDSNKDIATYYNSVLFKTPFNYSEEEITVNIQTPGFLEIKNKTDNLTVFALNNSIQVSFREIPSGISSIDWISEETMNINKKLEFLGIDGTNALFLKILSYSGQKTIKNFKFSEDIEDFDLNMSKVYLTQNDKLLRFNKNERKVEFISDLSDGQIYINYTLENAIIFDKKIMAHDKTLDNEYRDKYALKIINLLPYEIDKLELILNEYTSNDSIIDKKICCTGQLKNSGNFLLLEINKMKPKAIIEIDLEIIISNYSENIKANMANLEMKLNEFNNSEFFELKNKSEDLLNRLIKTKEMPDNKGKIDELNQIAEEVHILENKSNQLKIKKSDIQERISYLNKQINDTQRLEELSGSEENKSSKAENLITSAEKSLQTQEFKLAEKYLSGAEQVINSVDNVNKIFEKDVDKMILEIVSNLNELSGFGICCYDANINELMKDKEILHKNLSEKDIIKAETKYEEISKKIVSLEKAIEKEMNILINSIKNKISELKRISNLDSITEYSLLKKELKVFDVLKGTNYGYIPPITLAELELYEKEMASIKKEITEKIDGLLEPLYSNNRVETKKAIKNYFRIKEDLDYLKLRTDFIKEKIENAYFELKEEAFQRTNNIKNDNKFNELAQKAENELAKGNFAKAITITGLTYASEDKRGQNYIIPGILITLLIIGLFIIYWMFGQKSKKEPKTLMVFGQNSYVQLLFCFFFLFSFFRFA